MNSKQMSELFDLVEVKDDNLETDSSDYNLNEKSSTTFENRCDDVKAIMTPEPNINNDDDIIHAALKQSKNSPKPELSKVHETTKKSNVDTAPDVEEEDIPGDATGAEFAEEVEKDISEFNVAEE